MALGSFFYDNAMASWIYDKSTLMFVEVNTKCLALYGYSKVEFLERLKVSDLVPKEHRRNITRYLKATNNVSPTIVPQRKKDGVDFQALVYVKTVEFYGRACAYVTAIDNIEILFSAPFSNFFAIKGDRSLQT